MKISLDVFHLWKSGLEFSLFLFFFNFISVLGTLLVLGVLTRNKSKIQPKLDLHNNTGHFSGLFKKFWLHFGANWGCDFAELLFTVPSFDSCFHRIFSNLLLEMPEICKSVYYRKKVSSTN